MEQKEGINLRVESILFIMYTVYNHLSVHSAKSEFVWNVWFKLFLTYTASLACEFMDCVVQHNCEESTSAIEWLVMVSINTILASYYSEA